MLTTRLHMVYVGTRIKCFLIASKLWPLVTIYNLVKFWQTNTEINFIEKHINITNAYNAVR